MSKMLLSQRNVFKIKSDFIVNNGFNINISIDEARKTEQLVQLGSSQLIRFIDEINGDYDEDKVKEHKQKIETAKKMKNGTVNMKQLLEQKDKMLMVNDLVMVVMNKKNYRKLKKGFVLNGEKFVRIQSTSGGVKNGVIFYCNEKIHEELDKRIDNGRDMSQKFVPAKLSAYRGLVCSASNPVSDPIGKVLVVHDVENVIKSDVILLKDGIDSVEPIREFVDDYEITVNTTDGLGLTTYEQMEKWSSDLDLDYVSGGVIVRNSFTKGVLYPFPIIEFAEEVAKSYIVKDVWGNEMDIRDVSVILTTSQLKLWDSYSSWEHYESCCKENNYQWSVTKQVQKELDDVRSSNYQFLQGLQLDNEQVKELVEPTVKHIEDLTKLSPLKTSLFMNGGKDINDINTVFNEITKALIINPDVINDKYIRDEVIEARKGFVEDAKLGRLLFNSNYQIASGDVYMLMESVFGLEPKGLLKSGQFYSSYWVNKGVDKVAIFRAPMISINNVNVVKIISNDEVLKWYRYMNNVFVCNAYDDTMSRLSGMDFDGDSVWSTNNKTIIEGITPSRPLVCEQKSALKRIPNEAMYIEADMQSFGDEIGAITNRASAIYELLALYKPDSDEYKELEYRLQCCQKLQQDEIDKSKGIATSPAPSHWFKLDVCESDFDKEICVGKRKPYYFIYNYEHIGKKNKVFKERSEIMSYIRTGMSKEELENLSEKDDVQLRLLERFENESPVYNNDTTMNRITHELEDAFKPLMNKRIPYGEFDYTVYMNKDVEIDTQIKNKINQLYKEYLNEQKMYYGNKNAFVFSSDEYGERSSYSNKFFSYFKKEAMSICSNEEELCNILIELCYQKKTTSKQFAWTICGKQIIKNLLKNCDNKYHSIVRDDNGDLEYSGKKYKIEIKEVL